MGEEGGLVGTADGQRITKETSVKEKTDSIVGNCEYSFELDEKLSADDELVCHRMRVLMTSSADTAVQFSERSELTLPGFHTRGHAACAAAKKASAMLIDQ